jgi:hypothetical protein
MGWGSIVKAVTKVTGFFKDMNPLVSLGVTLFLSWVLRPKVPEIPDFGTNDFDDFERGLLINKQSNDSNIPVIYGERLVVELECLWKLLEQIILTCICLSLWQKER